MKKTLRASKAGFPCERNLWYSVNKTERELTEHTNRIFDVGTCLEPLVVDWLRQDGWEVEYNQGSQEAPIEIQVPVEGGVIAGHPDCFISRGNLRNILVDIKTMNDRAFTLWKREGSLKSKPQYVEQLHIYARGAMLLGRTIEKLGIVGLNKNNSDLYIDIFDYDPEIMQSILDRSQRVFAMNEAPEENSPREEWCCGYCEYSDICELRQSRHVSERPEVMTANEVILEAMKQLKEARELGKQSRELEAEAKTTLDAELKDKGINHVEADGLILTLKERESSRFDSKAFGKAHPELLREFTTVTKSVMYDLKEVSS